MSKSGPAGGMAKLHIDLFGGCSARQDGDGPCFLPTRKSQALLAYLAVPAGRFHAREKLTAMFWGETPEAQARQSFRQALLSIRRAVGSGPHPILLARNGAVAIDAEAVTVDVALLEAALANGTKEGLEQAAALYKGEFLAGFNLNEQAFEEWRIFERERLNLLAVEALTRTDASGVDETAAAPGATSGGAETVSAMCRLVRAGTGRRARGKDATTIPRYPA